MGLEMLENMFAIETRQRIGQIDFEISSYLIHSRNNLDAIIQHHEFEKYGALRINTQHLPEEGVAAETRREDRRGQRI